MWSTISFTLGFVAAGAVWVAAGLPFPIPTYRAFGVVLLLSLPYCFLMEGAGYTIEAKGSRFSGIRLLLVGILSGTAALVAELAVLWLVSAFLTSSEWASAVVWLVFPFLATAAYMAIVQKPSSGQSEETKSEA